MTKLPESVDRQEIAISMSEEQRVAHHGKSLPVVVPMVERLRPKTHDTEHSRLGCMNSRVLYKELL